MMQWMTGFLLACKCASSERENSRWQGCDLDYTVLNAEGTAVTYV